MSSSNDSQRNQSRSASAIPSRLGSTRAHRSQQQYDRITEYIDSGKKDSAMVHLAKPDMRIVKEEIFGPVGVVIKFKDEDDVIRQANETIYGLASAIFTQNINRVLETARRFHAGTAWINCVNQLHGNIPFGGCKQSGIGCELGEYALSQYVPRPIRIS
ncbi:Aldehyde/histidinol dehydrogenase [Infundibulicybe gibba]|nr:Aldehyde/histidinol dehydrogenase [Infundibulicybe gibba]